tara:strand:+ start:375 stop:1088 length:714 start_codon:yes stop_codon:yes gene_type:complete
MNSTDILSNKYFIFYIPGSMGSLLSVLIHSQIQKDFNFVGFNDSTAHSYVGDTFTNTHDYPQYLNFKKNNLTLEEHLIKNIKNNDSLFQRCDINWCEIFLKNKSLNSIICYIDDPELKLNMLYSKLRDITLNSASNAEMNFTINKTHKNYEEIIFIKTITWWMNQEIKYMKDFPSIDMLPIIQKKEYSQLEKFCTLTNTAVLDTIIDDYNSQQNTNVDKFTEFPSFIKKYLKIHHNI